MQAVAAALVRLLTALWRNGGPRRQRRRRWRSEQLLNGLTERVIGRAIFQGSKQASYIGDILVDTFQRDIGLALSIA